MEESAARRPAAADAVRWHALRAIPWLLALCLVATAASVLAGDPRRVILGLLLASVLLGTDVAHRRTLLRRQEH